MFKFQNRSRSIRKQNFRKSKKYWRCRGSNPGPFTCKANALPLSHIPIWTFGHFKSLIFTSVSSLRKTLSALQQQSRSLLRETKLQVDIYKFIGLESILLIISLQNVCIGRESNPGHPRGRRVFYHQTTDARSRYISAIKKFEMYYANK